MTSYFPGIVLATLGLLVLATSTSAEGGWILWSGNSQGGPDAMTYKPFIAYPSARECTKGIDVRARAEQRMDSKLNVKAVFKRTTATELWVEAPAGTRVYKCLPDTEDPRGPKGGK